MRASRGGPRTMMASTSRGSSVEGKTKRGSPAAMTTMMRASTTPAMGAARRTTPVLLPLTSTGYVSGENHFPVRRVSAPRPVRAGTPQAGDSWSDAARAGAAMAMAMIGVAQATAPSRLRRSAPLSGSVSDS
ncbi:hypothetical protein PSCLAVI8L_80020 [Pseudoclavibacter sp. 8L]|nr:hypothetical protein PSCLAVI8L_80020 [Pseudoclavibacter sp. 8L]